MQINWVIITGEYPPQPGGVSDYTKQVCEALVSAGDSVLVIAPSEKPIPSTARRDTVNGVNVHRISDNFRSKGRHEIDAMLRSIENPRILIQYTPQSFGLHGMNVGFARWVHQKRVSSLST